MKSKKILYGVCGIGMGHTYRQLPLLDELAKDNRIVLFVYGESKVFYEEHFRHSKNVTVLTVSVPFYVGNAQGLDFAETARLIAASGIDHEAINLTAMELTQKLIGKPDLVISDYEPVSAQYAYASGTPLVTIDQQSKYLIGDYSQAIAGQTCLDEVARLRLFFPAAALRLACSFFTVPRRAVGKSAASEEVIICPPIIKPAIVAMKKRRLQAQQDKCKSGSGTSSRSILVYISSQRDFVQSYEEVLTVLSTAPGYHFHVFVKELPQQLLAGLPSNVTLRRHGDPRFLDVLAECQGIVTTGGHTLVSEAMYLGIPAYLIPLAVYEQQINAHAVGDNNFGVCAENINQPQLKAFLSQLESFAANIINDKKGKTSKRILVPGSGEKKILAYIQAALSKSSASA
jgi:uncharacterized protein (TIGR00661 family)